MFFDMGQKNEKGCEGYTWWQALPRLEDTQESWILDYLSDIKSFNHIRVIGSTPVHGVQRLLWKLERS